MLADPSPNQSQSRLDVRWLGPLLAALIVLISAAAPVRAAPPPGPPPEHEDEEGAAAAPPAGGEEDVEESEDAEPAAPVEIQAPGNCDIEDPADPLYQIVEKLDTIKAAGFVASDCRQVENVLQGRWIEVRLEGSAHELLLYVLERLATDGYWIELTPVGGHTTVMVARPSLTGERGVRYVRIDKVSVDGSYLPGDDPERVERILGLADNNFYPADVSARLQALGYRAEFFPVGPAEVIIQVAPGRSIRRIRVRGNRPLPVREVQRQLSIEARPGALARGRCVEPKRLRDDPRAPICDPADVACREWEKNEIERIERYLFDSGYLKGTANLALACGRAPDEADLYVYLDKGKPYKIARRGIEVVGAPTPQDERWIRRRFLPRSLLLFRKRVTRDFMDDTTQQVEAAYAEPAGNARLLSGNTTRNPHPQIQLETSYQDLERENVPADNDLPLRITLALGREVETSFSTADRKGGDLSFGEDELEAQLQLFKRRERPSSAVARREAANLRAFYQSKGFLLAQVSGYYEDFGAVQKLRFEIEEGPRARIRSIRLPNPDGPPPGVLQDVDKQWRDDRELRPRSRLSETALFEDLATVLGAYSADGYLCATAQARVAFWPGGLEEAGAHAVLTPQLLLSGQSTAPWIEQFDPAGLEAIANQKRVPLYVVIDVVPGPRVVTSRREQVRYLEQPIPPSRRVDGIPAANTGAWGARRMLHASPLRARDADVAGSVPIDLDTGRDTKTFVVQRYRSSGFPVADAELTWRYRSPGGQQIEVADARDLADPDDGICSVAAGRQAVPIDAVLSVYEGKRGEFGEVLFRGNFKTREYVLRRELRFGPGDRYSRRAVERSAARIEATGTTRGPPNVRPYPVNCDADAPGDCKVHQVITVEEAKDLAIDVRYGLGAATLNPTYVFVRPKFPNLWGTGWDFDIDGLYGIDWSIIDVTFPICDNQPCYEQSARTRLSHPHIFGSVLDFELVGQVQRRVTPARGQIFSAYGNPRLSWRISDAWSIYFGYLIQQANISKDLVKPLGGASGLWVNRSGAVVPDRTGLIETGVRLARADNPFNPNSGYLAGIDFKLASPWLGGQDWWARVDVTWQHFIPIPRTRERLSLRYSLRFGEAFPINTGIASTQSVPEVWRYYGGGTADLGIRGILPETMLVDYEEIQLPYGGVLRRPRAQGGHIRAIGTVAWQVVSVKDFLGGKLAHSVFYDFGVLFQRWSQLNFARDYRHSIGINAIKWDIDIVTLALGYAILVPGNVRPTDDRNGRVVFDVGVTF